MHFYFILVGFFSICKVHGFPTQDPEIEINRLSSHGNGLTKHLVIDTWITLQQYQILLDNGIPVKQNEAISNANFIPSPYAYPTEFLNEAETLKAISKINKQSIIDNLITFSAFYNRHYQSPTGLESSTWLLNLLNKIVSTSPAKIQISKFDHTWKNQFSLIAKFPGSDPFLPVLIIGAHQDSLSGGVNGRGPGSDDNASGSMTILETFTILAASGFSPKRTVEFHWYSAEEAGLLGSKAIASNYSSLAIKVYAMLNYDVIGYTAKQNNPKVIGVFTDYTDPSLNTFLKSVVEKYTNVPWKVSKCNYGCSDHAAWTSAGYPAAFLAESEMANFSPYMHSVNDVIDTVDFDHLVNFCKIALGFLIELGHN